MDQSDPAYRRVLHETLGEEFKFSTALAENFTKISGKADLLDVVAILVLMEDEKYRDQLEHSLNQFLTTAKLAFSDEIVEFKRRIHVMTRVRRKAEIDRAEMLAMYQTLVQQESMTIVGQSLGVAELSPEEKLADDLLTFIDRISNGSCTELTDEEQSHRNILEGEYKVSISVKGWLTKTYQFDNPKGVAEVRARIARGE